MNECCSDKIQALVKKQKANLHTSHASPHHPAEYKNLVNCSKYALSMHIKRQVQQVDKLVNCVTLKWAGRDLGGKHV